MTTLDQHNPPMEWRPDDNAAGCWVGLPLEVWAPPFTDGTIVSEQAAERIVRCLRECGEHELAEALR